jgi:hypothetical protein
MKYVVQLLSLLYMCLFRISWIDVIRLYDRRSRTVLWIYPCAPARLLEYLGRSVIVGDLAYVDALARNRIGFRVVVGKRIGRTHGARILYNPSHQFMNPFSLLDYPTFLAGMAQALEHQNNRLLPGSTELAFWENKGFMQDRFAALDIAHPATHRLRTEDLPGFAGLSHPFLVKELHSAGGKGLHKIETRDQQARVARRLLERGQYEVLAQRIVAMTRDLRVTVIGDEIVLAYWRINPDGSWRPTGTSGGSRVVFGDFPERWRGYFVETARALGLGSAAFDVAWEADDVATQPMILEVSSFFQPNPPLPERAQGGAYRDYKKRIFGRDPFFKTRVDVFCRIAALRIAEFAKTARFD